MPAGTVSRRRIYLQRLVGDNVLAPKKVTIHRVPMRFVIVFLFYLILATVVITTRSNVGRVHKINAGMSTALREVSWASQGRQMFFDNITNVRHINEFMRDVLVVKIIGRGADAWFRRDLTLLSFNRVIPAQGACEDTASIKLTMRRVQTTTSYDDTTTSRFQQLFPRTWVTTSFSMDSAADSAAEATGPLAGVRDASGARPFWYYSPPPHGYGGNGGYVAVATIQSSTENTNGKAWMHLMDYTAAPDQNESLGLCQGISKSTTLHARDFFQSGFLDDSLSSIAIEFMVYNANLQALSKVVILFRINYAGRIVDKTLTSTTILLDNYSDTVGYFELFYFIFTLGYLIQFLYTLCKRFGFYIRDPWTWVNFISIVMSLSSLTIWYAYQLHLADFVQTSAFLDPREFDECEKWVAWYRQASAVATLMIYLRLLQFLAKSRPRVMLLARTLQMGAGNMAIYLSYIGIVFYGFAAFATTYFSAYSSRFGSPTTTLLSCFYMFFGQTSPMDSIDAKAAYLKTPFYVLFMVFFYFISVQMFNAVINYSYNRVSESMGPTLERERTEAKRKALKARLAGYKSPTQRFRECFASLFRPGAGADVAASREDAEASADDEGKGVSAPHFENLDDETKNKVEHYLNRDKATKAPDSALSIIRFVVFACCYIWFLAANLSVNDNFQLQKALGSLLTKMALPVVQGDTTTYDTWDQIVSLPQSAAWTLDVLPRLLFNNSAYTAKARAVSAGIYSDSAVCLKGWNCIVSMTDPKYAEKKLVRITQRRANVQPNDGRLHAETPDTLTFTGGRVNTTAGHDMPLSQFLVSTRSAMDIDPDLGFVDGVENASLALPPALTEFCSVVAPGDEQSHGGHGGMVCLLDADYASFTAQLVAMVQNKFFTPESSSWVIDFAMQNTNRQILSYVTISFATGASGTVEKVVGVQSLYMFNLNYWLDSFWQITLRLLPGILYTGLTFNFAWKLWIDFKREKYRRWHKDHTGCLQSFVDFFRLDVFNTLELISICVSLWSGILFLVWLQYDGHIQSVKEEGFSHFLSFAESLASQARLYNRLSASNVLMIGMRPFKFVRDNPRIAKFIECFWEGSADMSWFVVMLFITMSGFVMLVYISFGPQIKDCAGILQSCVYCFRFILGDFDYDPLLKVDVFMTAFMFPYVVIMYCVFSNIFFAIVDRHFVAVDPQPFQWKRKLKPFFSRICRCIEWDEDYVMEDDPNAEKKLGPPSRRERVKETQLLIQSILASDGEGMSTMDGEVVSRAQDISEVCDVDQRLDDVLTWSRTEARRVVAQFNAMIAKKRAQRRDEKFVKKEVMETFVATQIDDTRIAMDEACRNMKYATCVHEHVAEHDQEILAKYITLLEKKIRARLGERNALKHEVDQLQASSDNLRNPRDRATGGAGGDGNVDAAAASGEVAAAVGDRGADAESLSDSSEEEDQHPRRNGEGGRSSTQAAGGSNAELEVGASMPPSSRDPTAAVADTKQTGSKELLRSLSSHVGV